MRKFDIPRAAICRFADRRFVRTRPSLAIETFEALAWLLPLLRESRRAVWFFTFADIATRNARSFPICTCTALQLANFWQDVSVDYAKGRIYLPLEDLRRHQVSEDDIAANRNTLEFCEMMQFEVQRAREWFREGWPLSKQVDRELAVDLELFSRGGQEILNAIERQGYAVLGRRPAISKTRKLALVARAALGKLL